MLHSHTKGYTLVEVLVAISVLLLALVGPLTIAAKGLQSAHYARQQTTALFLAQEGIETVVAMRNDALITAVNNGSLNTAWNWVDNAKIAPCFANSGCNFDVNYTNATKVLAVTNTNFVPVSCTDSDDCVIKFDAENPRARYNADASGRDTEYTRVITLTNDADPGTDMVYIEVKVSWSARVFGNDVQSVTLNSSVYRIYEENN